MGFLSYFNPIYFFTDMKIKQDVVNRALDLMEQNGVKYFGIISNQCDVGVVFV